MDVWGTFTKTSRNPRTGEETQDDVLLQADPVNKLRYERKGFTFKEYANAPGVLPAIQACTVSGAAEQIWGFRPANGASNLDDSEIVKQAAEIALRKMSGTYTQAEAVAEEAAHLMGEYKAPETPFAIVQGDPLEGYKALAADGQPLAGTASPAGVAREGEAGTAGTGTTAPSPPAP